jgi:multicomponent Na+:H+ antiporter subunit D
VNSLIDWNWWLPLLVVLSSFVPGVLIFFLRGAHRQARGVLNLGAAVLKIGLIGVMLWGVFNGIEYETRIEVIPNFDLVLDSSPLAMLFVTLSGVLWLVTTVYAIGYLEHSTNRSRFFGFFSLCVSATTGIALAGNLFSFIIFYEFLTLTTYPLVVHNQTDEARRAGRIYLAYTLGGGALLLLGIIWLHGAYGAFDFADPGALDQMGVAPSPTLAVIFFIMVAGLGVKAAIVPLHSWLPRAMVAPAPVSALLHAVAVVKAGAFGIVRVVYNVYGVDLVADLGVHRPLAVAAGITIIYGSVLALYQDGLKRMLAFSTVSQLSYIMLGVATLGPLATIGGLVHLVHQGLMKITLFFCAGAFDETLGVKLISKMGGVGRRMPLTMIAFTVAALGMIGLPPLAGFISKWYLGMGAAAAGSEWAIWVLVASTLLNAGYFLPVVYTGWFGSPSGDWDENTSSSRFETAPSLLLPTLATAFLVIFVGIFANTIVSPLAWVEIISDQLY